MRIRSTDVLPRTLALVTTALLGVSTATGQEPASAALLEASGIRAATVVEIPPVENGRQTFELPLTLGGTRRILDLTPHSLRAPGYRLLVDDGSGPQEVPAGLEGTYRGAVRGVAHSQVALSLWKGQVTGQVHLASTIWNVEPVSNFVASAAAAKHIVYRQSSAPKRSCGGGHNAPLAKATNGGRTSTPNNTAQIDLCEIALDCENEFYKQNGSDRLRTQNAVMAVLNAVDVVYRRDVEICYSVTTTIVRTSKVYRQGPNVGCITGPNLLIEMLNYWNANHTSIQRDIAHMFSGGTPTNNIAGCAYVGVICNRASGYGVSNARGAFASTVSVVTHEIGHNWNLNHCADTTPCNVMCGGCLKFGPKDTATVYQYKRGLRCLGVCGGCREDADYTYFGRGCKGTGRGAGANCLQANWNQSNRGVSFGRIDYAFSAKSGNRTLSIESVEFYVGSSAPVTIPVQIFAATPTGTPGATLGTATMQVRGPNAAYKATFAKPVVVLANTDFFVGLISPRSPFFAAPISTSGTRIQEYWRSDTANRWNAGSRNTFNYRINCTATGATPVLSGGKPKLGAPYQIRASQAKSNALCLLFHSVRPSSIDLTAAGAPGCTVFVDLGSIFLTQGKATDGAGTATFNLSVPNNSAICGVKWNEQVVINDPAANRLGWVATRRGQPTVGN